MLHRCDDGYESTLSCSSPDQDIPVPSSLIVSISSSDDLSTSFRSSHGGIVGYQCGVIASGKAAVFNQDGRRLLETVDLNMTSSK